MHSADDISRRASVTRISREDSDMNGEQIGSVSEAYGFCDDDSIKTSLVYSEPFQEDEDAGNANLEEDRSDLADSTAFANITAMNLPVTNMLERFSLQQAPSNENNLNNLPEKIPDDTPEEQQLPSATADAMELYENIQSNIYLGSATGKSIAEESMPCECKYDPDLDHPSVACGDDNYCINRLMFMECILDDCPCGRACRNRRFQLRQYSRVDVIRTEKKGFGLRALTDLPSNAFIMEYIGEVIPNSEFIRRTRAYGDEGLKHYYFMTLKADEIIDATKKGCLARFMNHSCSPNCVTQKWVVGKTMRIGIFTQNAVKAGTELTFDYKFERYGAVAQECYCGEPNCKGYIGGAAKDDTAERSVEPSENESKTSEESDSSDSEVEEAVTLTQKKMIRKIHRRRASEPLQDPDKVQSFVKKMLDSVGKKHLVNMLLRRLELTNANTTIGRDVLKKFVRMHGLQMLKFWLREWKSNPNIVKKVLCVLEQLPLANRNGLEDCNMFDLIQKFTTHSDQEIASLSQSLLDKWSELKSVYRIPKRAYVEPKVVRTEATDEPLNMDGSRYAKKRYNSSSSFFEHDDDYLEYVSLNDFSVQNASKPQHSTSDIPTAPRAMLDHDYQRYAGGSESTMPPVNDIPSAKASNETLYNTGYTSGYTSGYNADYNTDASAYQDPYASSFTPTMPATPRLPQNWSMATSDEGAVYYYNTITLKTQWAFPEEKVSSVEGANQSQIEDLVEKAMLGARKKREQTESASPVNSLASSTRRSPRRSLSPRQNESIDVLAAGRSKDAAGLDDSELKKEVGRVVTKYLTAKQKALWNGDKQLFKELARKITHHIVDRETKSSRKVQKINSSVRAKIEKLIDSHGHEFVKTITRKKRTASSEKTTPRDDTTATSSRG